MANGYPRLMQQKMSWSLLIPWPLERIIRQYVGFSELVIREYNDLIEYNDKDISCRESLVEKRSGKKSTIAQWRIKFGEIEEEEELEDPFIYHFRFVFDKNWNSIVPRTEDSISLPRKVYMDIVKKRF